MLLVWSITISITATVATTVGWMWTSLNLPKRHFMGWIEGSLEQIGDREGHSESSRDLSQNVLKIYALCSSTFLWCSVIGTLLSTLISKNYGTKFGIHISSYITLFSGLLSYFSITYLNDYRIFLLSRGLLGISTSVANTCATAYLSEIASLDNIVEFSVVFVAGLRFGYFLTAVFGVEGLLGNEGLFAYIFGVAQSAKS